MFEHTGRTTPAEDSHTSTGALSPNLADLEQRLRANGTVVVPFKDYLEIRLPLFASVRVRISNGQLACEARFGAIPRDRATWVTLLGIATATAGLLLNLGVVPLSLVFGFLGVSSTASTAIRYQLTESCITRVQMAWMLMTATRLTAPHEDQAPPALAEAPPDLRVAQAEATPSATRPR